AAHHLGRRRGDARPGAAASGGTHEELVSAFTSRSQEYASDRRFRRSRTRRHPCIEDSADRVADASMKWGFRGNGCLQAETKVPERLTWGRHLSTNSPRLATAARGWFPA